MRSVVSDTLMSSDSLRRVDMRAANVLSLSHVHSEMLQSGTALPLNELKYTWTCMYNLREALECTHFKFTVSGWSKQTNIHVCAMQSHLLRLAQITHDRRRVVLSTEEQEKREARYQLYKL